MLSFRMTENFRITNKMFLNFVETFILKKKVDLWRMLMQNKQLADIKFAEF